MNKKTILNLHSAISAVTDEFSTTDQITERIKELKRDSRGRVITTSKERTELLNLDCAIFVHEAALTLIEDMWKERQQ
jgi:hypothetical protein